MTKTWLMRRSVRRPPAFAVTLRISSSVCRLPFISISPLAAWISSTRLGGRGLAVRRIDDLEAGDVEAVLGARLSLIFASGPTRIGRMMPAFALSTAPRSEVSSQGCTTMVGTGGTAFAAAIRRSYLLG